MLPMVREYGCNGLFVKLARETYLHGLARSTPEDEGSQGRLFSSTKSQLPTYSVFFKKRDVNPCAYRDIGTSIETGTEHLYSCIL